MAYNETTVLGLVKARLNRLASDTSLDEYFKQRISASAETLSNNGIKLITDSVADSVLLADMTVWKYQNRDKPGAMPEWLKVERRERWLQERGVTDDTG